jgi:hypothetical protein
MDAAAIDPVTAAKMFTYDILSHTYPVNHIPGQGAYTRNIPIQTLPQGTFMHNYFSFPPRAAGQNDIDYQNTLFVIFLGRYGINVTYEAGQRTMTFCFSGIRSKYQYYYPNPCAGFGAAGLGSRYNCGLISITKRNTRWAYLNSGTKVQNTTVHHRGSPSNQFRQIDNTRIIICDELRDTCHFDPNGQLGNNYDICLTPEFMRNNQVDGITAIAVEDDLMDITRPVGSPDHQYNRDKSMFNAINGWYNEANRQGLDEIDQLLWRMNLLCLSTDYMPSTGPLFPEKLKVGFREFCCPPSGWREVTNLNEPQDPLPAEFGIRGVGVGAAPDAAADYKIFDNVVNGNRTARKVQFNLLRPGSYERVRNFIREYFNRNTIMRPGYLFTPFGSIPIDADLPVIQDVPVQLAQIPGGDIQIVPNHVQLQLQWQLNHNLGAIYQNENNANFLGFHLGLNVFIYKRPGLNNIDVQIPIQYQLVIPPGNIQTPYRFGYYIQSMQNGYVVENYKIAHELLSNSKWHRWMCEYAFHLVDNNGNEVELYIPVGPFYNALSLPITRFNDMVDVYMNIVNMLENGAAIHSFTHANLNNPDYRNYVGRWMNSPTVATYVAREANGGLPEIRRRFTLGYWFPNLRAGAAANVAFIASVIPNAPQQGGYKLRRKLRGGQTKTIRMRTNKPKISGNTRQINRTKKQRFLVNKQFQENLTSGLRNRHRKFSQNATSRTNKINTSSNTSSSAPPPTLHASPDIEPMDRDTFESLKKMFANPDYSNCIRALFETPTNEINSNMMNTNKNKVKNTGKKNTFDSKSAVNNRVNMNANIPNNARINFR